MDFASFLKDADSARAARVFSELTRHDVSGWALTGGVAIELQILRHGGKPMMRPLHDLDFITGAFNRFLKASEAGCSRAMCIRMILRARCCCRR